MKSKKTNHKVSRFKKHDANLRKNSKLYFQVGLIVVLLMSYIIVEKQFKVKEIFIPDPDPIGELSMNEVKQYKVEEPVKEPTKTSTKEVVKKSNTFKVVENTEKELKETTDMLFTTDESKEDNTTFNANNVNVVDEYQPVDEIIFTVVQEKPIFPGCEDAEDRGKCMQEKIDRMINKKFDREIASDHELKGKQIIYAAFKIDENGNIVNIHSVVRGDQANTMSKKAKEDLINEANRVIGNLPKFKPGKHNGKNVVVPYMVPIKFVVTD